LQRAKSTVAQNHAALIMDDFVGYGLAEGRHFDQITTKPHVHDREASTDNARATEKFCDGFQRRVRCDIKILGFYSTESVSNTASNQIGLKAVCVQYLNNLERTGIKNPRSELVIADALGCWRLGFFAPKKIEHLFQDDSRGPRCCVFLRGMFRRCRRSHKLFLLMPSLAANSVSVSNCSFS